MSGTHVPMGLEFLARVQRSSLAAAAFAAIVTATYAGLLQGAALGAGALWCLVNLGIVQHLVIATTGDDRRTGAAARRAALATLGMLLWFGVGALLLWKLPPMTLAAGFTLPFAVMVLKAFSSVLIASPWWPRVTRSRWAGVAVLAVAALAVWALTTVGAQEGGHGAPADSHAAAAPAEHGAADPHAAAPGAHGEDAHGEATHAAKDSGPKKFQNFIGLIAKANHGKPWADFLHHYEVVFFALIVATFITIVFVSAARTPRRVPTPFQNVVEKLVEMLYDFVIGILGPRYGPRYVPFLGTLFLYIWLMNLFGLVPLMESPTASLNTTLALALAVFGYVHFTGMKELGPLGWLDHLAGNPRSVLEWCLVPLMLPIHVIGELAKPVSLSCRLFGNIFGEDMLLVGFATLGTAALAAAGSPIGVPLHLPFMFLALMMSTIQALVFTMLSTVYLLLMLPHDDHGHGHEEAAHHAH